MSSSIEEMIKNESVIDVLRYFGPGRDISIIDRMYVSYKFEVVSEGVLLYEYKKLFDNGELKYDSNKNVIKGPNWKEPDFVTQKKYDI
ncbi:hypothetical protein OA46_22425 [Enterobacter cloacae]|nr:hypothetical protein OA46_22425 [Enterobacter cloacae]